MKTRFWIILFSVIAVFSLAASLFLMSREHDTMVAGVYSSGELVCTIDLSEVDEPYEFTVTNGDGYNTIHVSKDGICVSASSCPDQICVDHGKLSDGLPIVCLPNRLVIRWESPADSEYDAMTGI